MRERKRMQNINLLSGVYKRGPLKEIFISNQCLQVTYDIENNCLKKPLSIYPQKIENLIILRKCIVGNQGLKTKHFNLLIFNDIYFLPYSSSACKSFYNILISSWVSVFLYKIQSSAYNQHDDDIRLGTSLTYNKNPKTVPCGTPLSYSTSTGFE